MQKFRPPIWNSYGILERDVHLLPSLISEHCETLSSKEASLNRKLFQKSLRVFLEVKAWPWKRSS